MDGKSAENCSWSSTPRFGAIVNRFAISDTKLYKPPIHFSLSTQCVTINYSLQKIDTALTICIILCYYDIIISILQFYIILCYCTILRRIYLSYLRKTDDIIKHIRRSDISIWSWSHGKRLTIVWQAGRAACQQIANRPSCYLSVRKILCIMCFSRQTVFRR